MKIIINREYSDKEQKALVEAMMAKAHKQERIQRIFDIAYPVGLTILVVAAFVLAILL